MHELFRQVLNERDLSRAGDLFSVPDSDIITDLNEVIKKITEISSHPTYAQNDNDQSVVEICVTRVTSCVRETGSVETFCGALVALLEACLHHNLRPTSNHRDDDPPHAKIASDVISCIFLASDSQNYSKRGVMEAVLPVAVKFLHKGNRELSRNMARYISLAAIHHAKLLKPHVQPIMDSIISGNYPLCRVLSQLYEACPEPLGGHAMALVSLLPHAEQSEKLSLLSLFELMASRDPAVLEASVSQLVAYLCPHTASANAPGCVCVGVLKVLLALSSRRGSLLIEHLSAIRLAGTLPHASPLAVTLVAQILTRLGHTTKERAQAALNFVVESMCASERGVRSVLWREATSLCSAYPALFSDSLLAALTSRNSEVNQTPAGVTIVKLGGGGGVGVGGAGIGGAGIGGAGVGGAGVGGAGVGGAGVGGAGVGGAGVGGAGVGGAGVGGAGVGGAGVGGAGVGGAGVGGAGVGGAGVGGAGVGGAGVGGAGIGGAGIGGAGVGGAGVGGAGVGGVGVWGPAGGGGVVPPPAPPHRRPRLGDSRSTGRLHTPTNTHRSMTKLHVAGGSVGGLHKSMTRLSSSQQMNQQQPVAPKLAGRPVTVTVSPRNNARPNHHHNIFIPAANNTGPSIISGPTALPNQSISVNPLILGKSSDMLPTPISSSISVQHSAALGHVSIINPNNNNNSSGVTIGPNSNHTVSIGPNINPGLNMSQVGPNMNPVTVTSRRANNTSVTMINSNANRISVFEPYPMRDTVQHFCEKHLDKIKAYMDSVSLRLPPPAKCTIEERRSKKSARLQFACGVRGEHCLYGRGLFSLRTSRARAWIHLMFLALQARHHHALSSRDASVASLKHCWDILKSENKTFLTIVTSAFPCLKEQEMLVSELRAAGFYDVFEACTSRDESQDGGHTVTWGCFLCVHPEKADGFVGGAPVMQGPLKEKKGRWRLFRRWRTRYFTLSGGHLSSNSETGGESIDINQIRSVKVSRGARNIPKAFEIFTGDQTLILKPKDGKAAEEWVQCLSIAVAHSQARDVPAKSNSLPARGFTLKNI